MKIVPFSIFCAFGDACVDLDVPNAHSFSLTIPQPVYNTILHIPFFVCSPRLCEITLWDIISFSRVLFANSSAQHMHMRSGHRSTLPSSCSWVFKYGFCVCSTQAIFRADADAHNRLDKWIYFSCSFFSFFFSVFILYI